MVNRLTLPLADWVGAASLTQANDAQLLHRFSQLGEQQAFTILVKRHGPMVWGVIRRLLRSHQDAEDVFQASFLVLARKAASLRNPQLLAAWLHGVAHRTALQLRSRRKLMVPLDPEHELIDKPNDDIAWRDCGQCIDRAIEQLPMRLRIVFLLCQAEGLTTLAASKRLCLPEGTVVSRLHHARKQLQGLLARHGITSAAGAVAAAWSLALPESLSALTVRSLLGSAPSALVAGLAHGVLTTMMWIKVTTAAVIVSTLGLVGAGAATIISQETGDKAASQTGLVQPPGKGTSRDDRIKQLEAQLAEARDREAMVRRQLETTVLKSKLLSEQLSFTQQAQDPRSKIAEEAQAREAKMKAMQEEEVRQNQAKARQAMDDRRREEQLQMVREAKANQERRTTDLMIAKEHLVQEIHQLQNEFDAIEDKWRAVLNDQQQIELKLEAHQQDLAKEMRIAELRSGPESDKLKDLRAKRDALLAEARGRTTTNVKSSFTNTKDRLQAQLKLRDKLLLEVEEKLLRMQLKLNEK